MKSLAVTAQRAFSQVEAQPAIESGPTCIALAESHRVKHWTSPATKFAVDSIGPDDSPRQIFVDPL
jgi:hypothetical protein